MSCLLVTECRVYAPIADAARTTAWDHSFVRRFELHKTIVHEHLLHEEQRSTYMEKSLFNLELERRGPRFAGIYIKFYHIWRDALLAEDYDQLVQLHLLDSLEGDDLRQYNLSGGIISQEERLSSFVRAREIIDRDWFPTTK